MKLLNHQIKYAKGYKNKELVVHEGGTGKSVCAAVWLADGRDDDALVVCSKRIIKKWQNELTKWGTKATVLSIEQFKKCPLREWSAFIIDEADEFASPLFTKQRSQRSTVLYELIKKYPDTPILMLTATPIRSTPWNLHTLLTFKDHYIDWKKWRNEFFTLERRPYLQHSAWLPKSDWRKRIRSILEKHADIVLMKDCVDEVPIITENKIEVQSPIFKAEDWEPSKVFSQEHRNEQTNKLKEIRKIAKEYRKVLVVAYYVEEIEKLYNELNKDRETFMVHGSTKNQEETLKKATENDECFLIVQASLGVGWDGDTFSCVVFTSMSYKVRDFVQLKYRVRRINNLHPVVYNFIIGGRCDKAVLKTIQLGKDFVPSEWS